MNLPFFASFILFGIWLTYELKKSTKRDAQHENDFWERERKANMTRRKPLDDLEYVTLDFDALPFSLMAQDETVQECHRIVNTFREGKKAVNLTGISNTDLKLTYGAPNITQLTVYDQNYTQLVRTLQKWADLLLAGGYEAQAVRLMEFCVDTRTDISKTYKTLAFIYKKNHEEDKTVHLREVAATLNSAMRQSILDALV